MAEPLTSQVWVAAWLQKADHDLETAERALYAGSPITDTAAYHCHQAAEKALKAFLASRFKPLVKTHDLIDLLTRCADSDVRFATCAANGPTLSRIREFDHLQPKAYAMKIRHFEDTDTLLIELKLGSVAGDPRSRREHRARLRRAGSGSGHHAGARHLACRAEQLLI